MNSMAEGAAKDLVRIHIEEVERHSPNPTTGHALYKLGHVPEGDELYREVVGHEEDELVPNDNTVVHLKQDEHFHYEPLHKRFITIIVNGQEKKTRKRRLTYDQLVKLAFNPVPTGPNLTFAITYDDGPPKNPEGELSEGGIVHIKNGMVFNVTPTDRS